MKKLVILICLITLSVEAVPKTRKKLTPEERAARREIMMQRTGGPVRIPQQGFVMMIDFQTRATHEKISAKYVETYSGFGLAAKVIKANSPFSIRDFSTMRKQAGAGSVLFVVDDPMLPMTLVSIETRSGLVNVAALATDNPSPALLTRRACKMIGRVAMLASGGVETTSPTCDLQPVTNLKELDMNEGQGAEVHVMMGVINAMTKAGVFPERRMTYLQACKEGLASQPTNKYQKAIWEKVHSVPKNPMKIEFDPKKGR